MWSSYCWFGFGDDIFVDNWWSGWGVCVFGNRNVVKGVVLLGNFYLDNFRSFIWGFGSCVVLFDLEGEFFWFLSGSFVEFKGFIVRFWCCFFGLGGK